ncbi:hypothetical protein C8R45DRAFT_547921 [Mycena sanguinolenta]|nr:hypothetical protein C8R45DRAFT_547921 [Mycena sanguinolenta]
MQFTRPLRFLPSRVTSRPQIPTLITRRLLVTVSQSIAPTQAVPKHPWADFYRTNINIEPFSCAWEEFPVQSFFSVTERWHDLTEMDFFVRRVARLRGKIRPLAFLPVCEPCVVFAMTGKYYYLDTGESYLEQFGKGWTSDDEFLAEFTSGSLFEGAKFFFSNDTDELYAKVCLEQRRRKRAAEKAQNS